MNYKTLDIDIDKWRLISKIWNVLNNIWNILMSPLKLIEGGGSYLELKVSNSIEDEMTKMSWWIRHGIVEEYKKYGIVEGESTLYVQDVSLNKLKQIKIWSQESP